MEEGKKHALDHAPPSDRTEQNTPLLVEVCVRQKMGRACAEDMIDVDFDLKGKEKKKKKDDEIECMSIDIQRRRKYHLDAMYARRKKF